MTFALHVSFFLASSLSDLKRSFTTLGKMQSTLYDFALEHLNKQKITFFWSTCIPSILLRMLQVQLIFNLLYFSVPDDGLVAFKY